MRAHIVQFVGLSGYGALQSTCKQLRCEITGDVRLRSDCIKQFICSRLHEYSNRSNNQGDTALMLANYRNNDAPSADLQAMVDFLTRLSTQDGVREFVEAYEREKRERDA